MTAFAETTEQLTRNEEKVVVVVDSFLHFASSYDTTVVAATIAFTLR